MQNFPSLKGSVSYLLERSPFRVVKSFLFATTSTWSTQQKPSKCLSKVNRKTKQKGATENGSGRSYSWSPVPPIAHTHVHEKTQTAVHRLIYFPSFTSIPGILWMENVRGLAFQSHCVSWAYRAVLVGSRWRDAAEGTRPPLHPHPG